MKQLFLRILSLGLPILLWNCDSETDSVQREGYRPIYVSKEEAARVASLPAQPLQQTGKIYAKDTLVFVNELHKGIHVINNKDPRNPQTIAFISVPGNVDIAVKGNILYADSFRDLVAINITDPKNITIAKRIADALPESTQPYPPKQNVYFECVDENRGVVVGWEKAMLTNPKCRR